LYPKRIEYFKIITWLPASDEIGINSLSEYIREFWIKNLKISYKMILLAQNFKDYCLIIICQEPKILFGTADKISALLEQILEPLLKRDDLTLDEIKFDRIGSRTIAYY
jgi:hypothetical protein